MSDSVGDTDAVVLRVGDLVGDGERDGDGGAKADSASSLPRYKSCVDPITGDDTDCTDSVNVQLAAPETGSMPYAFVSPDTKYT